MRKILATLLLAALGLIPAAIVGASNAHPTYKLGKAKTCRAHYVKKTERGTHMVTVKVKKRVHGKVRVVKVKRRESYRYVACVYKAPKSSTTTATLATAPTTTTTTTPPSTPAPVVSLAASVDPSYTQDSSDPYKVTWSYSASANETVGGVEQSDPSLPDGVLELYSDGSLVNSSDVGGAISSATATVTYASWGDHVVDVIYDSGTSSGTSGDESYDIEPPDPQPLVESWGTSSPTSGASISATVSEDETSDDVTLTDPNFEGASVVTLTDQVGDKCSAPVSGTTAECTMANTATPASFVVGYPGGTTTTQTIDPYGVDQSQSVEWPSDQVTISSPSVTVPSTTDVTDTVPDIDAYAVIGGECGTIPNPENYECFEMGVQWAGTDSPPTGGTVTLTATAENETSDNEDTASCTVDLSSATTCYTLYDSEPGLPILTSGNWSIAATYSGFDNDEYSATDWAAITTPVDYTMTYASGSWYDYQGSGS